VPKVSSANDGLWRSLPIVTRSIIAVCVAIYVFAWLSGLTEVEYAFGMSPVEVALGEWWRLVTATFLHASIMHILFNMYALLVLGASLERVLGPVRFAAIYFMSALGGSVAALWFSGLNTISVGASGAIFGLMTATVVVGRRMHIDTSQIMFWLVLNVVIGFLAPGIDWRAHLGGALLGAITAHVLTGPIRTSQNPKVRWLTVGLIFAVLVVEILVRNQQILSYLGY
jgi:membrane associated rhomboid family serine protease